MQRGRDFDRAVRALIRGIVECPGLSPHVEYDPTEVMLQSFEERPERVRVSCLGQRERRLQVEDRDPVPSRAHGSQHLLAAA